MGNDLACVLFLHEHAEANIHKNNGLAATVAGHRIPAGRHTKVTNTLADLYLTLANGVLNAGLPDFPTSSSKLDLTAA